MELRDVSNLERRLHVTKIKGGNAADIKALEAALAEARYQYLVANASHGTDSVWRWHTSSNIVPAEFLALVPAADRRAAADARSLELVLLRQALAKRQPSEEELAEMRAAFGAGTEVVNVLTGVTTRL